MSVGIVDKGWIDERIDERVDKRDHRYENVSWFKVTDVLYNSKRQGGQWIKGVKGRLVVFIKYLAGATATGWVFPSSSCVKLPRPNPRPSPSPDAAILRLRNETARLTAGRPSGVPGAK